MIKTLTNSVLLSFHQRPYCELKMTNCELKSDKSHLIFYRNLFNNKLDAKSFEIKTFPQVYGKRHQAGRDYQFFALH